MTYNSHQPLVNSFVDNLLNDEFPAVIFDVRHYCHAFRMNICVI